MRLLPPLASFRVNCLAILALVLVRPCFAQEPSAQLRQADVDYRAGTAALAHNDLQSALSAFQEVVRLAPAAEQGHSALGAVLVRLNRPADGIRELNKALAIKPSDSTAQMNLAMAYQQNGQPEKSLPLFAKLEASARAEKRPIALPLLLAYIQALSATQQYPAALAHMNEAVRRNPNNAELQDQLGSLYAQRQDWPNAEKAFTLATRSNPKFAFAFMHLGLALDAQQKPGALDALSAAYDLAPQNPLVALQYGIACARANDDDKAIPALRTALQADHNSAAAAYQLGLALQRTNHLEEATPLLQQAASADPGNAEAQVNLGLALVQSQKAKDAVPVLQRAVALAPENVTAHQNLAAALIQLNQLDEAVTELRLALKLSPDNPTLHYNLGLALKMKDDAEGAIPELESARTLNPTAPEPPYLLGVLYMQVARYPEAAQDLNASLKLQPQNGDGWATLGSVYSKLDQLPEAVSALREAIRQLPRQPDPHLTLAAVLAKQGHAAEAAAERKISADLMRANMNRQRAEVASNSANSQMKSGDFQGAIEQLREAIRFDPDYPEAHAALAIALEHEGKSAEAYAERQKAEQLKSVAQ